MSFHRGTEGKVTLAAVSYPVTTWTVNVTVKEQDVQTSLDNGFSIPVILSKAATGSFNFFWDDTANTIGSSLILDGALVALTFQVGDLGAGATITIPTALILSSSATSMVRGAVQVTVDFKSSGSFTLP